MVEIPMFCLQRYIYFLKLHHKCLKKCLKSYHWKQETIHRNKRRLHAHESGIYRYSRYFLITQARISSYISGH